MMLGYFQAPRGRQVIFFLFTAPALIGAAATSGLCPISPPAGPSPVSPSIVIAPPHPNVSWPAMAIVPTESNIAHAEAARMAASVRKKIMGSNAKRWKGLNIYVFNDVKSAQRFKAYQDKRQGRPLQAPDFVRLTPIWPKALAFYTYSQGRERVSYPRLDPKGWWKKR